MKPRHSECPHVHLGGGDACRDCVRLYERDEHLGSMEIRSAADGDPVEAGADHGVSNPPAVSEQPIVDQSSPKPERIEAAKVAVAEGVKKSADSAAKRQARYREKHGEAYRKREAARMAAKRGKGE